MSHFTEPDIATAPETDEERHGDHHEPEEADHRLGDLQPPSEGENWWDKVHGDMLVADDPYIEEQPGAHKSPVAHDWNAVIFWLEQEISPALTGEVYAAGTTSGEPEKRHKRPKRRGDPSSGTPSGHGTLADPKKWRVLESYAMDAATVYDRARDGTSSV